MALSLAGIGESRSGFNQRGGAVDEKELPIVQGLLEKSALDFITQVQANINKKGLTSKGNMSDLVYNVTDNNGSYLIEVGYSPDNPASKYYDYQNKGVAGVGKSIASPYAFKTLYPSRAMMTSILSWLNTAKTASSFKPNTKPSISKLERKRKALSKVPSRESIAYAISVSIKRDGIDQTRFFDDAIVKVFGKGFIKKASEALKADISIKIINYGDNN
jgi:hypothetical protein